MKKIQKIMASSALVLFANLSWATAVEEQTLLNNLAYGQLIELNQYSPGQQRGLMLRLFATPAGDETCGLETGTTCRNKHLITVATFDALPEVQVHTLQAKGEFVKADWVVSKRLKQRLTKPSWFSLFVNISASQPERILSFPRSFFKCA
jgi:hypothetical protein